MPIGDGAQPDERGDDVMLIRGYGICTGQGDDGRKSRHFFRGQTLGSVVWLFGPGNIIRLDKFDPPAVGQTIIAVYLAYRYGNCLAE